MGRQLGAARPAHATVCRSPCAPRCPVASGHGPRDCRAPCSPLLPCSPARAGWDEDLTPRAPAACPRATAVRRMWPRKVPKSRGSAAPRVRTQNWARSGRRAGRGADEALVSEMWICFGERGGLPGVVWRGRGVAGGTHGYAGQTAARCCGNHGDGRRQRAHGCGGSARCRWRAMCSSDFARSRARELTADQCTGEIETDCCVLLDRAKTWLTHDHTRIRYVRVCMLL